MSKEMMTGFNEAGANLLRKMCVKVLGTQNNN